MLFFLYLLLPLTLFSLHNDPFLPEAPPERKHSPSFESYLIGGLVNPATGQFSLSSTDLIATAVEPLHLTRHYYPPEVKEEYSEHAKQDEHFLLKVLGRGSRWIFFTHLVATFQYTDMKGRALITITEPDGTMLQFKRHKSGEITLKSPGPFTNSNGEMVSSSYDSRNTHCSVDSKRITVHTKDGFPPYHPHKRIIVHAKDGSTRYYEYGYLESDIHFYYLTKERLLSGKIIVYYYDRYFLTGIESKDPHEHHTYARITRISDTEWTTHTGLKATYQFTTLSGKGWYIPLWKKLPSGYANYSLFHTFLSKVDSPLTRDSYSYSSRGVLLGQSEKSPIFSSTYSTHKEFLRISNLQLPIGNNDKILPTHRLEYGNNPITTVTNPDGTKSIYYFTHDFFLTRIDHDQKTTLYGWNADGRLAYIESCLLCDRRRCIAERLLRKEYESDSRGNPIVETLIGNLTGEGGNEHYRIHREYNNRNLLIKEKTDAGLTTTYTYLEGTNLITSKAINGDDGLYLEERYTYDDCHNLIETVINGRTTRYILHQSHPHLHMVEWIEKEDHKIHLHYDQYGHVTQEDHYDGNGAIGYSIFKEYNAKGELLSLTNPIGQRFTYAYDNDGNLIFKSKPVEKR